MQTTSSRNNLLLAGAATLAAACIVGLLGIIRLNNIVPLLAPPLAASAMLAFVMPALPASQPRAIIFGNLISACVGAAVQMALGTGSLSVALAAGLAMALMQISRTIHPPAAATSLVLLNSTHEPVWAVAAVSLGACSISALAFAFQKLKQKLAKP